MGNKERRRRELCRKFCVYYKAEKYEDLSCLGSRVVEALVAKRGDLVLTEGPGRAAEQELALAGTMCGRCPFYPDDCDYIIERGDAPPCGGFLALSALMREEIITIDEVRDTLARLL